MFSFRPTGVHRTPGAESRKTSPKQVLAYMPQNKPGRVYTYVRENTPPELEQEKTKYTFTDTPLKQFLKSKNWTATTITNLLFWLLKSLREQSSILPETKLSQLA